MAQDPGLAALQSVRAQIIEKRQQLQVANTALSNSTGALQRQEADTENGGANAPAYAALLAKQKLDQANVDKVQGDIDALTLKAGEYQTAIDKAKNPPDSPTSPAEKAKFEVEQQERAADRAAGGVGHTKAELAAFDSVGAQSTAALSNAQTNAANVAETARSHQATEQFNTESQAINERLANKQIDQKQAEIEQNALFNRVKAELDRIDSENKAASTAYQGALTERGQNITESTAIKNTETTSQGQVFQLVASMASHIPRGQTLTFQNIIDMTKIASDTIDAQATKHGAKNNQPTVPVPQTIQDTASGKNTQGVKEAAGIDPSVKKTAEPAKPTGDVVVDTSNKVASQYKEWVDAGGKPDDWEAFKIHSDKLNGVTGSAPSTMPASFQKPAPSGAWDGSSPQPAYTPPTPAQTQTSPGLQQSVPPLPSRTEPQQVAAQQGGGAFRDIIINPPQPAAQPQQQASLPVADPNQDAEFQATSLHQTSSILNESGIDTSANPLLAKYNEVPPPVGAFPQYLNSQQQA